MTSLQSAWLPNAQAFPICMCIIDVMCKGSSVASLRGYYVYDVFLGIACAVEVVELFMLIAFVYDILRHSHFFISVCIWVQVYMYIGLPTDPASIQNKRLAIF